MYWCSEGSQIHQKCPAQHAADLDLLESKDELLPVFTHPATGLPKSIDCIRVDGASDEGPSHDEVQFWWTSRHLSREKVATLVTTRSSGSSYLNRVELQNGCLSLGHASTFIPSTISGSCIDPETGTVDEKKLQQNLDLAIDAYICRVNGAPCGDTTIQLYKGCKDSDKLKCRQNLLIFLKGSRKAKAALKQKEPEQYAFFQSVWDVRTRHMVPNLPSQYIFMLLCCYRPDCCHPVCKHGPPTSPPKWYTGGPPITHLPLPVLDEQRLWGSECQSCHGTCSGHYKVVVTDITNQDAVRLAAPLPSNILKDEFSRASHPISDDFIQVAAEKALLNQEDNKDLA